jgi:hypothetical protein
MRIGKCFLAIIVLVLDLLSQDVMVNNINFIINDQQVEIRYDLDGDQESKYKVDLVMKRKARRILQGSPNDQWRCREREMERK